MVLDKRQLSILIIGVFAAVLLLSGCEKPPEEAIMPITAMSNQSASVGGATKNRWYSRDQVARGYEIFQANCVACHKSDASGTPNWREADASGKYPPPPLNGTAHTWHHPLKILRLVVNKGGLSLGGSMPGFEDKLDAKQVDDVLAWVQSNWPDDIYQVWRDRYTSQ